MDNKFKRIIEFKKQKGSIRKPKYATRKLSIGLVSCMLGYALLVSPSSVEAAELEANNQAVEESATEETADTTEETTTTDETTKTTTDENEAPAEEATPAASDEAIAPTGDEAPKQAETTEEAPEVKGETLVEDREAFTLSEAQKQNLKEAGFTDSEIANIESSIDNSLKENKEFDVDGFINEKISSKKADEKSKDTTAEDKLEVSEEKEFGNQGAGEVADQAITDLKVTISGNQYENASTIKPVATSAEMKHDGTEDNILRTHIDFKIPEGTKSGSHFDVKLSNNVNLNGVYKDAEIDPLTYNGIVIADVEQIEENRSLRYTFNEIIDNLKDIDVSINLPLFIDRKAVPKDSKETVSVDVTGADAPTTKEFDVVYDQKDFAEKREGNTISGRADIDQVTDDSYRQTIYYNTNKEDLAVPYVYIGNQPKQDGAKLTPEDISDLKVYRLKDGASLNTSYALNEADLEDITDNVSVEPHILDNNRIKLQFNKNANENEKDNSTYVVVYTGKRDSSKDLKTRVDFLAGKKYTDDGYVRVTEPGEFTPLAWKFDNEIVKVTGSGKVDAELVENGKFQEHHIYITIRDGVMEEPIRKDRDELKGTPGDSFTTSKKDTAGNVVTDDTDNEGYELIQVIDSDNVCAKKDGSVFSGNYEVGKKKEVTYIYQRVINSEAKTGTFKETHVYKTLDYDGNVIEAETKTEPGKSSEGTKDEPYTSAKVDKDGYVLDKVTADEGSEEVTISDDGKSVVPGNYVEDKNLSVTYEYVKQPGRFIEHHIYKTVDKDGKEVSTDYTENNPKEGEPAKEGYSNEKISTAKQPKDGYTFSSETTLESENYVPGKTLEKTYIYTKTEEPVAKKGSFKETHVYITKDFDGNVIEAETKTEAGKSTEGTKEESYTSSKVDKDGYVLDKVTADEGSEEVKIIDGKEVQSGNYVEDKELSVTYEYVKQPGRFIEHHIYKTVDKDGKEVSTDYTENNPKEGEPAKEGYSNEKISTAKQPKDGYTFSSETTLESENYVPGKTLEKTYIYTKTKEEPVVETGSFQDHHIYISKDKDGKEISRKEVPGDLQKGKEDDSYTTGKKEKDGFKFVRTENPVENPTFDEEGKTTKGKYRPGVKQEITYVYERTETPLTPLEPSEPETPLTPLEPSEPETPLTPLEPSEPVEPGTPGETPDIPWTPLEPSEPVEPGTPGETPETPEKPENPEKPEKPGKENPTSPEGEKDNKDNKVQVPVVEAKKETKKETPVRKNGNPKTGVGSISGAALGLIAAASGLFVSKKNKDEE